MGGNHERLTVHPFKIASVCLSVSCPPTAVARICGQEDVLEDATSSCSDSEHCSLPFSKVTNLHPLRVPWVNMDVSSVVTLHVPVLQEALYTCTEGHSLSAVNVAHAPGEGEVSGTAGRGGKADCRRTGGGGTQEASIGGRGAGETPAGRAGVAAGLC